MLLKRNQRKGETFQSIALILCVLMQSSSCKKESAYKMSSQEFVTKASSSNNFEIAAGAIAQEKSTNDSVQLYSQQMITDHTFAELELKTLGDRKNWQVSTTLTANHQQNLQILSTASTEEFDLLFAQLMVESHQETVSLFEIAAANRGVPDIELRSLAAAKLPTLRAHLKEALNLQSLVTPKSSLPEKKILIH